MERYLTSSESSPLRTLKALEGNLKRERRVFSMVVLLLAFAAICAAATALASLVAEKFGQEENAASMFVSDFNAVLMQRQNLLTAASLLLEKRMEGALALTPRGSSTVQLCKPLPAARGEQKSLQAVCEDAALLLSHYDDPASLQFLLLDGSAAYGDRDTVDALAREVDGAADPARLLIDAALDRLSASGVDPVVAARERQVIWFRPPPESGVDQRVVVGATIVLKGDQPYALVLTSVDLRELSQASISGAPGLAPVLVDPNGAVLAGDLPADQVRRVNLSLFALQDGRFHLVRGYGWGLREPAFAIGFGHMLVALPWIALIHSMRGELVVVLVITGALIALLFSMARYWNYQLLTRTYGQTSRALEGEILNHLMVHATPVGLCIVRRENLEIVVANQIVRNVLGLDNASASLPNVLRVEFEKRCNERGPIDGKPNIIQFPFSLNREGQESVHLEVSCVPAVLNRQDVFFCSIADATERHEAEQLLREAKLTSDAAAKEKVNFFASMSHEIRTPLSSLVGNIELVALGPLAPEQEARVRAMQISATSLLQVVNDMLDFSKIDVGEMRLAEDWGCMTQLIDSIVLAHASLAVRQKLKFYVVIDRSIPARLFFDPVRIVQILGNLLSNAFKFTQSGKIVLRARWVDAALEISVTDSGIGIPDDLRKRLFRPFTQGEGHRLTHARGTGLGLSICGRLCELMNGHIALESTVAVGTRIVVTLPLRADCDLQPRDMESVLSDRHAAILCRAIEYQEWLTNLFDPQSVAPTNIANMPEGVQPGQFDYLLVTDEFTPHEVAIAWGANANVVWVRQDGPLVPAMREGGGVEVSVFSVSGIKAAIQMLRSLPQHTGRHANTAQFPAPRRNFGQVSVLIVEDNLLNRGLLRDQLRTLGANVIEAKHGEEALAILVKGPVDIVMTDIDMPVMNGFELLHAMRDAYPAIPVYAISASALPEDPANGRSMGFADYLNKPVPLALLSKVLDIAVKPVDRVDEEPIKKEEIPHFPKLPPSYGPVFVEQAGHDLDALDEIFRDRDLPRLRGWAHNLSGGLSVLGPSKLFEQCQALRAQIAASDEWSAEIEELAAMVAEDVIEMREAEKARINELLGTS